MMNKLFAFSLVILSLNMLSCNLEEKNYSQEISTMKDTLFKAFPTVNRVNVEVKQDFGTEINITLGDVTLYNETTIQQQEAADKIGTIVESVFNNKNLPDKGTLIIVKEETTIDTDASKNKTYDMHLHKQ